MASKKSQITTQNNNLDLRVKVKNPLLLLRHINLLLGHPLEGRHNLLGGLGVSVQSMVHEGGPGGSNDPAAPTTRHCWTDEDTPGPVRSDVILVVDVIVGRVHDHRGALGSVAKLGSVCLNY